MNLLQQVNQGTAHVITAKDYFSLPDNLKAKYYPLFRRADTTYRMYPQYMKPRKDVNMTIRPPKIIIQKEPDIPVQIPTTTLGLLKELPREPILSSVPTVSGTDVSKRTKRQLLEELKESYINPATVRVKYSRYQ